MYNLKIKSNTNKNKLIDTENILMVTRWEVGWQWVKNVKELQYAYHQLYKTVTKM